MYRRWTPYFLLAPALSIMLVLVVYPLVFSLFKSFHYYHLFRPQDQRLIGLDNYVDLLTTDTLFWTSLWLTGIFTVTAVGIELVIGGLLALWLFRFQHRMGTHRLLFMVPMLMAPVVVGLTWRFMYDPVDGIFNVGLRLFGIPPINWLNQTSTSLISVMITDIWQWMPFVFVVLFAGMMSLPVSVQEAARLDGAGYLRFVWRLMLPMLRPIILIVLLIRMIDAFKMFDQVFVLTHGGPGTSTFVMSFYASVIAFRNYNIGVACALSFIFVFIVGALTYLFVRLLGKELFK